MFRKSQENRREPSFPIVEGRRVTAIASGKGGTGKTWLAASLAGALAQKGERVLLVDGDLALANVDVQLGLAPDADLADIVAGGADFGAAVTPFAGGCDSADRAPYGFDVVSGRSGYGALALLSDEELAGLRRGVLALADHYDRVIVDLGPGLDRAVTAFCADANEIIAVLTEDPSAASDAYAMMKVLGYIDRAEAVRVVVNQAETAKTGRAAAETFAAACREFLKVEPPLLGVIRRDAKVREAVRAQQASWARHALSPASQDVAAIAKTLRAESVAAEAAAALDAKSA